MFPPLRAAASSSKVVSENMQKLQKDREFLQSVISGTLEEVVSTGHFTALTSHLLQCQQEKVRMEQTILRWVGEGGGREG